MHTRLCACACVALCIVVFGEWSHGFAKEIDASEMENLKKQIVQMEEQLRKLRQKVDQSDTKQVRPEPLAQAGKEAPDVEPDEKEQRLRDLERQVQQQRVASRDFGAV